MNRWNLTKCLAILLVAICLQNSAFPQSRELTTEENIIKHFQNKSWKKESVTKDSLYTDIFSTKFNVSLSNHLLTLDSDHQVIKNPYFRSKYEYGELKQQIKNFPKSYSVIYQNSLVSLFENGRFYCLNLEDQTRNTELEKKINKRKFKYHWIINGQLGGIAGNSILIWNGDKWKKYRDAFPIKNQPILFEDEKFIVFSDCSGEFGGTVYFLEKSSSNTYFTESTCAVTVTKDTTGYLVLANLGHGRGSAEIKNIDDPTKLSLADPSKIGSFKNGMAYGYADKSKAYTIRTEFRGLQLFSSFKHNHKTLYIVNLPEITFLAEIDSTEIKVVHPLFYNDLYTHNPVTKTYGKYTLINLDFYGIGLEREIGVLVISDHKITKIDWNEKHNQ